MTQKSDGPSPVLKVCIVIAAYDEKENIVPLTARIIQVMEALPVIWTVIYVIEGTDGSLDLVAKLAADKPQIQFFYNPEPSGLGRAFRRGFEAVPSDTDLVVTMDADLNHQPEEIPRLLEEATSTGADIVIGSRRVHQSLIEGLPLCKRVTSWIVNRTISLTLAMKVKDMSSGFRVYRAGLLRRIHFHNDNFAFLPEVLIQAAAMGAVMIERPIHFIYREAGRSKMAIWTTSISYLKLFGCYFLRAGAPKTLINRSVKAQPDG